MADYSYIFAPRNGSIAEKAGELTRLFKDPPVIAGGCGGEGQTQGDVWQMVRIDAETLRREFAAKTGRKSKADTQAMQLLLETITPK